MVQTPGAKWGGHGRARHAPRVHRGRARRAPQASQMHTTLRAGQTCTASGPDVHCERSKRAPRASQTRTANGPDTHRGRARRAPCTHHEWAKRAPRAHCKWTRHAPRAHQMGIVHAPELGGADEGWGTFGILIYNYLLFHYVSSSILMSSPKTMKTTCIAL